MEENIAKFVSKHLELLLLEKEENLQNFFKDLSPASLHHLEKKGQALTKLAITNLVSKGPERFQIDLERVDGLSLDHRLSSGDLVICIRSKEKKQTLRGIVVDISEITLSINVNDQYENIEEDEIFIVVKTDSDVTYRTQTRALTSLKKRDSHLSYCSEIISILFDDDEKAVHNLIIAEDPIPKINLDHEGNLKYYNISLAKDQRAAVEFAIKNKYFTIIQGPPGTGKTTTLIEIIVQLYRLGKKILICAPTNVAVDNLVVHLAETEAKPLRLGHPTRIAKDAMKYSMDSYLESDDGLLILKDIQKSIKAIENDLENKKSIKYAYKEIRELKKEYKKRLTRITCDILRRYAVILSTLNSSSIDGYLQNISKDHFDVLIVDEASQAMEASMWIAIPNAPKLILAGDINQLPPVVMSQEAANGGLNISLMERAIKKLKNDCFVKLTRQYRMNEKIMMWSNDKFYENTLEADDSVKTHLLKDLPSVKAEDLTNEAIIYVDTCGCECEELKTGIEDASKGNPGEAVIVDKIVTVLLKAGVLQKDIGVITPYALQVDFIRRSFMLKSLRVEVSTVDGFQGREKDVIILSLVRSNEDKELGFVTDFRRLNVAVTRARRSLIVIADSETMEKDELIVSLLKHIEKYGLLQTAEEYLSESMDKEIEQFEKNSQGSAKPKTKSKVKANPLKQIVKVEDFAMKIENKNQTEIQSLGKKINKGISHRRSRLIPCENAKKYNVYEAIATDQIDEHAEETESLSELDQKPTDSNENKKCNIKENKKKKQEIRDKPKENLKTDNFYKVVEEFKKSNSVCSYSDCKVSTKLIKLVCEFCKKWFCIEHGLQEIHGCGDAIRRKVQKEFRHRKPEVSTKKEKDKFTRKLKELEEARKPKKKSTK